MALFMRILRGGQAAIVCYVLLAVLYTTKVVLKSSLCIGLSQAILYPFLNNKTTRLSELENAGPGAAQTSLAVSPPFLTFQAQGEVSNDVTYWTFMEPTFPNKSQHAIAMMEDLFLSKAFAQSMQPNKIVPFFYKATGDFEKEDITITTLITRNRFKVFSHLVQEYQGPISVALHVKNVTNHIHSLLDELHQLYISTPHMSTNVDVHLIIDSFDRQFNSWRNVARLFARTNYVMMLDVDFAICTDFRNAIRSSNIVMDKLREGQSAFVIPAFEFINHSEGLDSDRFPKDKESLLSLVRANRIDMFHSSWPGGHNSTDYPRYYSAQPGEIYRVTQYQSAYEPYVVFKKEGPPWCDERFVGYGGNKAACLFEMYLSGISYFVLADHFLIHQSHLYEEVTRKHERKYNRRVFTDFKEETCLRYLKSYYDHGLLNTTRAYHALEECMKVKGVSRLASQLFV